MVIHLLGYDWMAGWLDGVADILPDYKTNKLHEPDTWSSDIVYRISSTPNLRVS